jgi:hypothetical protein
MIAVVVQPSSVRIWSTRDSRSKVGAWGRRRVRGAIVSIPEVNIFFRVPFPCFDGRVLETLLGARICVANLERCSLSIENLSMEFLDYVVAGAAILEPVDC